MSGFSTADDLSLNKNSDCDGSEIKTNIDQVDDKYEVNRCADWINKNEFKDVCMQFPDKLLIDSAQVMLNIKTKVKCNLYILGDTSYGSCCVDEVAAEHINADSIIHFGHACLGRTKRLPVLHIFEKNVMDCTQFVNLWRLTFTNLNSNVILFYDVSYHHYIDEIITDLKDYTNLVVSQLAMKSSDDRIMGRCLDKRNIENDFCHVYIGSDNQTFFNISLAYSFKDCYLYDPLKPVSFEKVSTTNSSWLKRRLYLIEKCKDAKTLGILIGTLAIEGYLEAIKYIQNLSKAWKKKSYIIAVGKPNPAKLANFPELDMFVLVGCPENTLHNDRDFYKPIITIFELDLALNPSRSYSDSSTYVVDIAQLLPGGCLYKPYDKKDVKSYDVSLITGKLRSISNDEQEEKESSEDDLSISICSSKQIMVKDGALGSRTWRGLEQNLGETLPQMAVPGRSGVPMSYNLESSNK